MTSRFARMLAAFAIVSSLAPAARAQTTYYWDNNGTTAGFGTAAGTWAAPTTGSTTQGWSTSATGALLPGSVTTGTPDTLNFGNGATGLAAGTITVSGTVSSGNITFAPGSGAIVLSGGSIALAAVQTTTVNNASSTIGSVLAGAGTSFTKAGTGFLILTGANSYTGPTIINAGTINLGGGTANGSLASTVLTLSGGSFNYTRTGTNTQTFTTTSITGESIIAGVAGNTLNLGTVSRGTGNRFYDFSTTGLGIIAADTGSNVNGIMAGFTIGDSWAVANGTGVAISGLAGASYTLTSVAGTTSVGYTNLNIDVDNNAGVLDAAITANSLRFSATAANTITLAAGTNTLSTGGILVGSAVGGNLSTITGGTLTGAASKDLVIIQNNTAGGLSISSSIVNTTLTSLTKSGGGLLTLDGNNTFTGGVIIHAGTVALGNAGSLNSATPNSVTFGTGSTGTLALAGNSVTIANLSTNATPGTTFVQNANGSSVANATLTVGNASNLSGTYAGTIRDGTGGGTLALTKAGTGTLTLSGANGYTGGTTLAAGTVTISNANSFGTGSISVTGSSRINVTGGITYANAINVGAALTLQNPATTTSTATFSGVLSGNNSITLPNSGTSGQQGILAFTNTANTFTGNVILSAANAGDEFFTFNSLGDGGNFTFAKNGNRQGITYTGSSNITFANRQIVIAATMVNGGATDRAGTDGNGTNPVSMFANDGTGTVTFNTDMVVNNISSSYGVFHFGGANSGNNTFAGNISDTSGTSKLAIGKFGTGKWILSGANTYEAMAIIATGTLEVPTITNAATAQPLGINQAFQLGRASGSGTLSFTGAASSTDKQVFIGSPINGAGGTGGGSILSNGTGALTFTNATFNPLSTTYVNPGTGLVTGIAPTVPRTLTLGGTYDGTSGANGIQGVIQNNASTGLVNLTVSGSVWTLSGTNTFTGVTTINGGVLSVGTIGNGGVAGNLGQAASAAANLVLGGGTLRYTGATASTNRALTLTNSTTSSIDVSDAANALTISGAAATSSGSLTKIGLGTLILAGANAYTGTTTVTLGRLTLDISGAKPNASPVVLNGGTLAATSGTTNGSQTGGILTLSTGSIIDFATPAGNTTLSFGNSSAATWSGTLTITGYNSDGAGVGNSHLFVGTDANGLSSSQLSQITFAGFGTGAAILLSGEVVPVPEPATAGVLAAAGLLVFRPRRSRK